MGKHLKLYLPVLLILLCMAGCGNPETETVPATTTVETTAPIKTGWDAVGTAVYYYDAQGKTVSGWQDIDGARYYFAEDGIMQTGWLEEETGKYYLGDNGVMQTGWLEQGQDRYYFRENGMMAVGQVEINGQPNFFTSQGKQILLVNFEHEVPEGYEPNLVKIGNSKIDASCADPLQQLLADCKKAGYQCKINSAYRSVQQQQNLRNKRYQQYREAGYSKKTANAKVDKSVAKPGNSEHHLGLAADIGGNAKMQKWLKEHAWEYGFIVRYPEGKTEYTGIIHEPWHLRYVGKELAAELQTLGLCLEEYMQSLTMKA